MMKKYIPYFLLVLMFFYSNLSMAQNAEEVMDGDVMSTLVRIQSSKNVSIEIMGIPCYILTRTRVDQKTIEGTYYYKLSIRNIYNTQYSVGFKNAVASINPKVDDVSYDFRWAIIFYDENDSRIGAFYFNDSGEKGAINSVNVSFNGEFGKWLRANFIKVFQ